MGLDGDRFDPELGDLMGKRCNLWECWTAK
jgi:hypothetical protein